MPLWMVVLWNVLAIFFLVALFQLYWRSILGFCAAVLVLVFIVGLAKARRAS
jgi:hypothetical protein